MYIVHNLVCIQNEQNTIFDFFAIKFGALLILQECPYCKLEDALQSNGWQSNAGSSSGGKQARKQGHFGGLATFQLTNL